jgi:hypothetical protein
VEIEIMAVSLDQVIAEVEELSSEQQLELRNRLDQLLAKPKPQMTEEEFERHLLSIGMISRLPSPISREELSPGFQPVKVKGKPVSETIIEERR